MSISTTASNRFNSFSTSASLLQRQFFSKQGEEIVASLDVVSANNDDDNSHNNNNGDDDKRKFICLALTINSQSPPVSKLHWIKYKGGVATYKKFKPLKLLKKI